MAKSYIAIVGIVLFIFVCLVLPLVNAPYISHIPVKTVWGEQIETLYAEGKYPGLECTIVSGDGFRDALFARNGIDPYLNSVSIGLVKPYDLFCGYDGQMVGLEVCYINE